eukprot:gene13594-18244_t
MFSVLVGCSLLGLTSAATWSSTNLPKVTILVGIDAFTAEDVYCAVSDNSLGSGVLHGINSGADSEFFGSQGGMLNMDIATINGDNNAKAAVMASLGGLFVSNDLQTYQKVQHLSGVSQNIEKFGTSFFGATGEFSTGKESANGVAVSSDAGVTWQLSDIQLDNSIYLARYGAFPSATTWYVSSGSWPVDESSLKMEQMNNTKVSSKLFINRMNGQTTFIGNRYNRNGPGMNADAGYPGAISKTVDGGKTWTKVYDSAGSMYFNQVHCSSELSCMAVAEDADTAFAVATVDGGNTWKVVLSGPTGSSFVAVRMLSDIEAWVGGGVEARHSLVGAFYHTTDGGATWTLTQQGGYAFDLAFDKSGVGYASSLGSSSSTVLIYK